MSNSADDLPGNQPQDIHENGSSEEREGPHSQPQKRAAPPPADLELDALLADAIPSSTPQPQKAPPPPAHSGPTPVHGSPSTALRAPAPAQELEFSTTETELELGRALGDASNEGDDVGIDVDFDIDDADEIPQRDEHDDFDIEVGSDAEPQTPLPRDVEDDGPWAPPHPAPPSPDGAPTAHEDEPTLPSGLMSSAEAPPAHATADDVAEHAPQSVLPALAPLEPMPEIASNPFSERLDASPATSPAEIPLHAEQTLDSVGEPAQDLLPQPPAQQSPARIALTQALLGQSYDAQDLPPNERLFLGLAQVMMRSGVDVDELIDAILGPPSN